MESILKLSDFVNMLSGVSEPVKETSNEVGKLQSALKGLDTVFTNLVKSGKEMAGVGKKVTSFALEPIEAIFDIKEALGELSSIGIKDLQALEDAGEQFSKTWAGTTKAEFLRSAYDIKSSISSLNDEAVTQYTEIASITAKGTKSSVDEMINLFATGYGVYKDYYSNLSDMEFSEMFSAGIATSIKQFKTDSSQMAQALQTLGASATSVNIPLEEQLSVLGMLQATMSGSEAGSKYEAFLDNAVKAGDDLGLSFTDANNQLLSMPEIFEQLSFKFGDTIDAGEKLQLQEAFGSGDAVDLIDLLYQKTVGLQNNIVGMYDSLGQGSSVATEMAEAINGTESNQYEIIQQKIQNIKESIGNGMLPTVNIFLDKINEIVGSFGDWVSENEGVAGTIMLIIGGIGMLLSVIGGVKTIIGLFGLAFIKPLLGALDLFGTVKDIFDIFKKNPDPLKNTPNPLKNIDPCKKIDPCKNIDPCKKLPNPFKKSTNTGKKLPNTGKKLSNPFKKLPGLFKKIPGLFKKIPGLFKKIPGVFKSVFGIFKGIPGLFKNLGIGLFNMVKQAIITGITALPQIIGSIASFLSGLLASPVTWIVIGIIALIGVIYLLWKNWDTIVAWVGNAWNNCVNFVVNSFQWIKDKIAEVPTSLLGLLAVFAPFLGIPLLIIQNWDVIKEFFSNIWTNIGTSFSTFFSTFLPGILESGKNIMMSLADGIIAGVMYPINAVKDGFEKVRNFLPFSDAKEGPLSNLTMSGSKIFSTLGEGMEITKDIPANMTKDAFNEMNIQELSANAMTNFSAQKGEKTVDTGKLLYNKGQEKEMFKEEKSGTSISIGNMHLNFDLKALDDIKFVKMLVAELKDLQNQSNEQEVVAVR